MGRLADTDRLMGLLLAGFLWAISLSSAAGTEDPIADWTLDERALHFPGSELYGHINGGAERFHELGFEELFVHRVVRDDGAELSVESYSMSSPESAFAIYLLQCGREKPIPGVAARNSGGIYQLSSVKGSLFLQVNNFVGDESLVPAMVGWANAMLAGVEEETPEDLFADLPEVGRISGTERPFRGEFTLQPIYTFGPGDILSLRGTIFGAAADYRNAPEEEPFTRLAVAYPDTAVAAEAFAHLIGNLDPYLSVVESTEGRLVFLDYRKKYGEARLDGRRIDVRIHLADLPRLE